VLISGGDPLTMSTEKIEHIIASLRAIDHVEIIRIGTRVPVVMPMRITQELTDICENTTRSGSIRILTTRTKSRRNLRALAPR
jgi:L-lysine 2,3-aminomutase